MTRQIQYKNDEEFNAIIAGLRALQLILGRERYELYYDKGFATSYHIVELAADSGERLGIEEIEALVERINTGIEFCKSCGTEINPATNLGFDVCCDCAKIQDSLNRDRDRLWLMEEDDDWCKHDDGHWDEREDWE